MRKVDIEEKFNLGIPCYNKAFMKIKDFTMDSYIKGFGNGAIDYERALRYGSRSHITDVLGQSFTFDMTHDAGMYQYISLGSNEETSACEFGFNDNSKLCSTFYPALGLSFDFHYDQMLDNEVKSSRSEEIKRLYELRSKLLSKDFSDIEEEYFKYLDTYKVINMFINKLANLVYYFVCVGKIDIAQTYLFTLSAYVKKYGDTTVKIRGNNESLKDFIKAITTKYPLKNEYLLRSGFLNKSKEDNDKIIDAIIHKTDLKIDHDLCESGTRLTSEVNHTGKKRVEPTEEEIVHIGQVLNDRIMFYLSKGPIGEIKPNGAFSKYGAFIYPNGIVVADRLYDIRTIGSLSEDAIYKFNAENFEERSKLSKTELTRIPGSKFYHTDTWKERTGEYIETETSEEMHEKALQLIKDIK